MSEGLHEFDENLCRTALEVALVEEAARHWTEQLSKEAQLNLGQVNRVLAHTLEIIAEHKVIVQALATKNPKGAAAAMKTHLSSVDHAIARLQPLHANYFVEE